MKHLHLLLALTLAACANPLEDAPESNVELVTAPLFGLPSGSYCGGTRKCILLQVKNLNVNRGADLPNHARAGLAGGVFLWTRGNGDFWFPRSNDYKVIDSVTGDYATLSDPATTDPNGWRLRTIKLNGGFAKFTQYYPNAPTYGYNYDLCASANDPGVEYMSGAHPPGSQDTMKVCWGGP